MPRRETDPVGNYNFQVEVEGVNVARFSEVSGLEIETEVIEYREGSDAAGIRKLPGLHKFGDITLKRGITQSRDLWDWYREILGNNISRRTASIILRDEAQNEILRWNLLEAWPRKYVGPFLTGTGSDVAIEEIVIACERIEVA